MTALQIEFEKRPSVVAYMLRALYPGVLRSGAEFPPLRARWRGSRPDARRLERFLRATGLDASRGVPVLYPMAFTFPLQMVILSHPACPLPIWKVLQVRNHILQRRPIPANAVLDAEAAVVGQRVLERGMELDVHVSVATDEEPVWEGLTSYHYRGHFGAPGTASPLAVVADAPTTEVARWRTDSRGGLRFSGVSGDYNGIHYSNTYARLLGFRRAFHHPHVLVGQSLARMIELRGPSQRLDIWLKGPIHYGSEVTLSAGRGDAGVVFALEERDGTRPALIGRWREACAGSRLLEPTAFGSHGARAAEAFLRGRIEDDERGSAPPNQDRVREW